ncbi:MAG: hypothetical protein SV765_08955 [Pseudomonadota bacterium]|nr:hypothetical protein [Pseudomonadota bacterium]
MFLILVLIAVGYLALGGSINWRSVLPQIQAVQGEQNPSLLAGQLAQLSIELEAVKAQLAQMRQEALRDAEAGSGSGPVTRNSTAVIATATEALLSSPEGTAGDSDSHRQQSLRQLAQRMEQRAIEYQR